MRLAHQPFRPFVECGFICLDWVMIWLESVVMYYVHTVVSLEKCKDTTGLNVS